MIRKIRRTLSELRSNASGNAALLVAIGMPALIGGAGLGTDTAQWYLWKRDLQFAVDQAALAGAYAKASSATEVQQTYTTRALQEYNANVSMTKDFDASAGPTIGLAIYGSAAANNSVLVSATATNSLPFSSMFTGNGVTVRASAQATYHSAANFTACMLALHPTAYQAFKLGNSVTGESNCGVGALSTDEMAAMKETGDTNMPLGSIVAGGAVDETFNNNGTVYEDQVGLLNPYEGIEDPDPTGQPNRTYPGSCPSATPASTTYTADGWTKTHYTYKFYRGSNSSNWDEEPSYTGTGYIAASWSHDTDPSVEGVLFTNKAVTSSAATGLQTESAAAAGATVGPVSGSGSNRMWRVPYTSTLDKFTAVTPHVIPATDGKVYLEPGVYSSIDIQCTTVFSPGIYFVSGELDFGNNQTVTGTGGVMFVMTGSSGSIHINSDSQVTLSGITSTQLTADYGYSPALAAKLDGMLIWDPDSDDDMTVNGNSNLRLSGVLYMPNRELTFNGNGAQGEAHENCMMIASNKIKIEGNYSLSNFCVTTGGSAMSIGGTVGKVRLVG